MITPSKLFTTPGMPPVHFSRIRDLAAYITQMPLARDPATGQTREIWSVPGMITVSGSDRGFPCAIVKVGTEGTRAAIGYAVSGDPALDMVEAAERLMRALTILAHEQSESAARLGLPRKADAA